MNKLATIIEDYSKDKFVKYDNIIAKYKGTYHNTLSSMFDDNFKSSEEKSELEMFYDECCHLKLFCDFSYESFLEKFNNNTLVLNISKIRHYHHRFSIFFTNQLVNIYETKPQIKIIFDFADDRSSSYYSLQYFLMYYKLYDICEKFIKNNNTGQKIFFDYVYFEHEFADTIDSAIGIIKLLSNTKKFHELIDLLETHNNRIIISIMRDSKLLEDLFYK